MCFGLVKFELRAAVFLKLPGPQKYETSWPFGLFLQVLGHYFTYSWGPCISKGREHLRAPLADVRPSFQRPGLGKREISGHPTLDVSRSMTPKKSPAHELEVVSCVSAGTSRHLCWYLRGSKFLCRTRTQLNLLCRDVKDKGSGSRVHDSSNPRHEAF